MSQIWLVSFGWGLLQDVEEKLCFFPNALQPFLMLYSTARNFQRSQHNASVQSIWLAGHFLNDQYQPSASSGGKILKILWEKYNFS